ncbi:MAG: mannose-1-phosphate guanylyltransferase/mannose-6-phosphate isomerase [Hyphomicrobiales bacterium]|nr:mannose-1-phosphate guanylyltransferase/mannose-6-phosphate isomerase [Hyphomicrobiales bacterium]
MVMQIVPVIMCGGGGTRLWPASRTSYPKPFVPLMGAQSTFTQTLERVGNRALFSAPMILASEAHRFLVAGACAEADVTDARLVLEPEARDTAAAITAAALLAQRQNPQALLLVLAADHLIRDIAAFQQTCEIGLKAAEAGAIVTFGIKPQSAHTGYGYIQADATLLAPGVNRVKAFHEKPDAATASAHVAAGLLWNSGNFLMRADSFLAEIAAFEPELLEAVTASVDQAGELWGAVRLEPDAFRRARKVSVDYAVLERSGKVGVVAASYDWSDLGTWESIWELAGKDEAGNALIGEIETLDASRNYVHSPRLLTTLMGVNDLAVVVTDDAVLISDRNRSAEVKQLVARLEQRRPKIVAEPKRGYRPWGHYETLDLGPRYQVKRIVVHQGGKLSLQKHFHRAETWTVVAGSAMVEIDGTRKLVSENESVYLPLGCVHRLENPGKVPLVLIEVQCGAYLGEDDIIRIEDVYARV